LEEVAAVWEGGELGAGVGALDALHGFGDVGEGFSRGRARHLVRRSVYLH
jgi:hypothetical protein